MAGVASARRHVELDTIVEFSQHLQRRLDFDDQNVTVHDYVYVCVRVFVCMCVRVIVFLLESATPPHRPDDEANNAPCTGIWCSCLGARRRTSATGMSFYWSGGRGRALLERQKRSRRRWRFRCCACVGSGIVRGQRPLGARGSTRCSFAPLARPTEAGAVQDNNVYVCVYLIV